MSKQAGYGARQSLGYLLNRTADIVATAASELLRPESISLLEWRVLTVLTDQDQQTLSELAAHAGTELSYLSRVVLQAEAHGYVRRFTSANDRRSTKVAITDAGRDIVQAIAPRMKVLEEDMLQGIPAADVDVLRSALQALYGNVLNLHAAPTAGRKLQVAVRVGARSRASKA
jgi:DNA-binding MarR family transcriptional regulator